ncbi:MAG: ATP-binding protein [Desulfuromonadales bacterium]
MLEVLLILCGLTTLFAAGWALYSRHSLRQVRRCMAALEQQHEALKRELAAFRSRNHHLVENAGEAMFLFDQDSGALQEANREARRLLGYNPAEVTHMTFKGLFSRKQRRPLLYMMSQARKTGEAEAKSVTFRRKDGSHFIGDIKVRTAEIDGRKIVHGTFHDTTPVINLQSELRRHNRHLSLLNQISQRVTEGHDLSQTLEIILEEVIKSLAISGGGIFLLENRGQEMKLAIHHNIPDPVVTDLNTIQPGLGLAGNVVTSGRPRMSKNLQKDHRRISNAVVNDNWRAFLAVPFVAEEKVLGVLFVFDRGRRDFTRDDIRLIQAIGRQLGPTLKNAELLDELQWQHRLNCASMRELERSRAALRENIEHLEQHHRTLQSLNQMKSSFLSLASHELRTPLTTILSGTEFLQEQVMSQLAEKEQRALDVIMRGSLQLNHIVENLLEAARLEAKTLYMAREAFNPLLMIQELVQEHTENCLQRGLQLELEDFPQQVVVRGDVHHLKRACDRLLENAVKFTPEGGRIAIRGRQLARPEVKALAEDLRPFSRAFFDGPLADHYLEIAIEDSGIGIEEVDRLRIFEKFQEVGDIASHSTSRASFGGKGVGLGLTLVKGIVETHEGLVWVESAGLNQGSCFAVLLPLSNPDEGKHVLG